MMNDEDRQQRVMNSRGKRMKYTKPCVILNGYAINCLYKCYLLLVLGWSRVGSRGGCSGHLSLLVDTSDKPNNEWL